MSVTLFEPSLRFYLEDQAGPTGLMLRRTAEQITGNGEFVMSVIIEDSRIRPNVEYKIETGDLGLQATIGIPFEGRVSERIALKWEAEDQILGAVMTNWDSQI